MSEKVHVSVFSHHIAQLGLSHQQLQYPLLEVVHTKTYADCCNVVLNLIFFNSKVFPIPCSHQYPNYELSINPFPNKRHVFLESLVCQFFVVFLFHHHHHLLLCLPRCRDLLLLWLEHLFEEWFTILRGLCHLQLGLLLLY